MVLNRIIPCLLIRNNGLVKTKKFKDSRYIGDPINAVKLFNEKQANELLILDIDATHQNKDPNFKLIEEIASEAFMPVCYGGGISSIEQMQTVFGLGIEKISISAAFFKNSDLIQQAVSQFGSSSITITLDVKKTLWGSYGVYTHNGTKKAPYGLEEAVERVIAFGVGELVINNIDQDGMMQGYDVKLMTSVVQKVNVPVIGLGGAGSLQDIQNIIQEAGVSAAAAGSLFVYHGPRHAVLINYPSEDVIKDIL